MHEGTDARVAAVTAEMAVVAKGAAAVQEQVESKWRAQLQRYLAAILLAEVDKVRSLDVEP